MTSIFIAIILGILFTAIAVQNPTAVPVNLFGAAFTLPLYFVAAVSFLFGSMIAYIFHLFDKTSTTLDIRSRESRIRDLSETNHDLQVQVERLSAENSELRGVARNEKFEAKKQQVKNMFGRMKPRLA
jgi:uncharacterized integral membrane protein